MSNNTFNIAESFQYEETRLTYVKYSSSKTYSALSIKHHITVNTANIKGKDGDKRVVQVQCNITLNEDQKEEPLLELTMQSLFTVLADIDLSNIKKTIDENEMLKQYFTTPVLSEAVLMIGLITQKAFKVPKIIDIHV